MEVNYIEMHIGIIVKRTNNIILHNKVRDKNKEKKLMVKSVVDSRGLPVLHLVVLHNQLLQAFLVHLFSLLSMTKKSTVTCPHMHTKMYLKGWTILIFFKKRKTTYEEFIEEGHYMQPCTWICKDGWGAQKNLWCCVVRTK